MGTLEEESSGQEWIQPPTKEENQSVNIEPKNICIAVYQLGHQTQNINFNSTHKLPTISFPLN